MRLVVLSNLFPPLIVGGYEVGAAQVVEELRRRGHEVLVLSAHEYHLVQDGVRRRRRRPLNRRDEVVDVGLCLFGSSLMEWLRREPALFFKAVTGTLLARQRYLSAVSAFRPERILAFNPGGLAGPVLADLVDIGRKESVPVSAFVSDHWLAEWPTPSLLHGLLTDLHRSRRPPVRWLGKLLARHLAGADRDGARPPQVERWLFCSRFLADEACAAGTLTGAAGVVHWGLPRPEALPAVEPSRFLDAEPLTVLYAGQIQEHKGLDVLLRALARCRRPHPLLIFGDDRTPFALRCKALAEELGLSGRVAYRGQVEHADLMNQLARLGHVLAVPSVWDEPFSLVVLEGMGLGLAVIAADTGGTAEAIRDGVTGLLVGRGNADELAAALDSLDEDRSLCRRMSVQGRSRIRERFSMARMVDDLLGPGVASGVRRAA
jgi:glycosyltransferase involved in cell wall biosynthesis